MAIIEGSRRVDNARNATNCLVFLAQVPRYITPRRSRIHLSALASREATAVLSFAWCLWVQLSMVREGDHNVAQQPIA